MQKPQLVANREAHSGRVVQVSTHRLRFSNGTEYDTDYIRHPGAAAVVAVDGSNRVCLVRQYRHAVDDFLWEIPAGKLDPGEPPEVCAVRELREETGVAATRWAPMGIYIPAPSLFTELIHLYLARDLTAGAANPDADEELEMQWMPLEEAIGKVLRGEWNDGKTAMALCRAKYHLQL
ncbi:MAG TPA: NUDIX hydrolase [Steroidobacteraceae bacterium]|nr:NUDIX hydrolase [Steroidobacteraceae bacterium]